jgi:hypothetical protein
MILNVHSDASHLSAPRARSCAGGYFFLGSLPVNSDPIKLNGTIHITCTILKLVSASAAEAKLGALFFNAQEAPLPYPGQTRTSTTSNTNSRQQYYYSWHHQ